MGEDDIKQVLDAERKRFKDFMTGLRFVLEWTFV